jgi:hypothetical protein
MDPFAQQEVPACRQQPVHIIHQYQEFMAVSVKGSRILRLPRNSNILLQRTRIIGQHLPRDIRKIIPESIALPEIRRSLFE